MPLNSEQAKKAYETRIANGKNNLGRKQGSKNKSKSNGWSLTEKRIKQLENIQKRKELKEQHKQEKKKN
mgnify:CR=1 FL=1